MNLGAKIEICVFKTENIWIANGKLIFWPKCIKDKGKVQILFPQLLIFNSCCDMFLNHVMIELKQWSNNSRLIIKSSLIMMIPCYTIACYTIRPKTTKTKKKKCRRVKAALKAIKNVAQFLPQTSIWICSFFWGCQNSFWSKFYSDTHIKVDNMQWDNSLILIGHNLFKLECI